MGQCLLYSSIILIKMAKLLFLTLLSLAAGGRVPRSADHHGDGHDENCVDILKYGPVLYNESITECEVVGYTHCENIPTIKTVRDDNLDSEAFTQQNCVVSDVKQTITEMKKMPVCQNITKH